jgi:GTP-binding protein
MDFRDVVFYKSIWLWVKEVFFDEKKEIVFIGRSNVGKSSIMNALFHKKDLVKTSSQPGKTKLANLFLVSNKYYFTDLPGYGFAKVSKQMQEDLDGLISWYLEERRGHIKRVVMLVDSKIWPQRTDIDMYQYLLKMEIPVVIILSKIDRISASELDKSTKLTQKSFFWQDIISVSASKKTRLRELEKFLKQVLLNS